MRCTTYRDRHPLQELVLDTFVPNDAFVAGRGLSADAITADTDDDSDFSAIRKDRNSIVVCTGANACGKVCTWLRIQSRSLFQ